VVTGTNIARYAQTQHMFPRNATKNARAPRASARTRPLNASTKLAKLRPVTLTTPNSYSGMVPVPQGRCRRGAVGETVLKPQVNRPPVSTPTRIPPEIVPPGRALMLTATCYFTHRPGFILPRSMKSWSTNFPGSHFRLSPWFPPICTLGWIG